MGAGAGSQGSRPPSAPKGCGRHLQKPREALARALSSEQHAGWAVQPGAGAVRNQTREERGQLWGSLRGQAAVACLAGPCSQHLTCRSVPDGPAPPFPPPPRLLPQLLLF